jgi:predicted NUDIX family NTP pyrophosphohydrolase
VTPARASAGLLLYRRRAGRVEVLLVHPGGPFWAGRDEGAWSIPKGEMDAGEDALACAEREFAEELGSPPQATGAPAALEPVRQRSGKVVHAWAMEGDFDAASVRSNTFRLEWPPKSGRMQEFPEVDRAGWFSLEEARVKMLEGQRPLLDQLARIITPMRAGRPGS